MISLIVGISIFEISELLFQGIDSTLIARMLRPRRAAASIPAGTFRFQQRRILGVGR